jgi:hypothetical protein
LIFLGLALAATVGLLANVILPEAIPVQYNLRMEAVSLPPALDRVQGAVSARWQGWADYYRVIPTRPALNRSQLAAAARWQGLAADYLLKNSVLSRAQLTDALRWTAPAVHYGAVPLGLEAQP